MNPSYEQRQFEIIPVPDMAALEDKTLDSLIHHEREVYGYEGFGEYLFCTKRDCRRIQSIDEVYGVKDTNEQFKPLKELEKNGVRKRCCPECESETLLIFDPLYFRNYLKDIFKGGYGSLVMDEAGEVQGSNLIKPDKMGSFFDEMNYKGTFDWQDVQTAVKSIMRVNVERNTDMVTMNRISIAIQFRGGDTFHRLLQAGLNLRPDLDQTPAFGTTRFDSNLYPIVRSIGFKNVATDASGAVCMGNEKMGNIRSIFNLSRDDFKRRFNQKRAEALLWQARQNTPPKGSRFYKDSVVLDKFQSIAEAEKQK